LYHFGPLLPLFSRLLFSSFSSYLVSFIHFLSLNSLQVPTIKNYISSIKSRFRSSSLSCGVFDSPSLAASITSLEKNAPPSSPSKPIFSPSQFLRLLHSTSSLPLHALYHVAFSFAFLAMLRISNLAPSSSSSFDPLCHFRRGDVTLSSSSLSIHLRWSKTLQRYNQSALITLYPIPNSIICPLGAFSQLQRFFPVRPSDPLLSYRFGGRLIIITQSDLRRVLRHLISSLGLSSRLTFHSFRRSAAFLASGAGLPFHAIQAHGVWSSDALLAYLDPSARHPAVPLFFSSFFQHLSSSSLSFSPSSPSLSLSSLGLGSH
jgi:integrase